MPVASPIFGIEGDFLSAAVAASARCWTSLAKRTASTWDTFGEDALKPAEIGDFAGVDACVGIVTDGGEGIECIESVITSGV